MTTTRTPSLSDLSGRQVSWIAGGLVMTLATMPGQTTFIAQFNAALRAEFGLSDGAFGGLYTLATLTSATGLVFAGVLADRIAPLKLALGVMAGLAATALLLSQAGSLPLLVVALALLRFFGQGMLMHVALTAMARWFNRFRGRALSLATFGITLGDSLLPFTLTVSIAAFGWRNVWIGTAATLALVLMPLLFVLLRRSPGTGHPGTAIDAPPVATGQQWRRARVLRDPLFWAVLPGIMAMPAIGTLFIFHQANLVAAKGWSLTTFTAFFPVLAVTVAAASLTAGFLVDRLGAWRLMPVLLLPLAAACLVLATLTPVWSIALVFLGFGLTQGVMNPVMGALWVELYGTAHIGAVRSLATAALVAASALGPGIAGWLIDAGLPLERQAVGYAGLCLACSAGYALLQPRFRQRNKVWAT
ncbi:MFS transporter (plasmid) [Cereibacter azotoformans]|uniref:MFS transporter n=1 Tax=Cereibacter azotoformans TaxID=43057 RepID=UPI001EEA7D38|nr:MFS transporter [Cereibacter azotoformans]ULB12461.1 MFS transporter [Cereibacter azotoformans]